MDQDQKHRCKFCSKTFRCGRSLGGHMRCHLSPAAADVEEKLLADRGFQGLGAAGYGLRENPKKTWRLSDSTTMNFGDLKEKHCPECGKEFQSWKALFGHMRCHSEKIRRAEDQEDQGSWSGGGSHIEGAIVVKVPRKKRRSRRMGSASASVSASEYSKEQEDVALGLMMLSRDVGYWGNGFGLGFNHFAESSDKNSAVLEDPRDFASDDLVSSRSKKLESDDVWGGAGDSDDNDDEFEDNSDDSFKKKKKKVRPDGIDLEVKKQSLSKMEEGFGVRDPKLVRDPERRSRYECTTCNRSFQTYQALGGHRASHKRMRGCYVPNSLEPGTSIDQVAGNEDSGMVKGNHQCLICGKVFGSGQALGGHKRSHLVMSSPAVVIQQEEEEEEEAALMSDLIDLNLPAPINEDSSKGSVSVATGDEFRSWWAGNNLQHKAIISMIAN